MEQAVIGVGLLLASSIYTITQAVEGEQELNALNDRLAAGGAADSFAQLAAAIDKDVQARAADGLIPRKLARQYHVCVADRAYQAQFQALVVAATSGEHSIPSNELKQLVPYGLPAKCPVPLPPVPPIPTP